MRSKFHKDLPNWYLKLLLTNRENQESKTEFRKSIWGEVVLAKKRGYWYHIKECFICKLNPRFTANAGLLLFKPERLWWHHSTKAFSMSVISLFAKYWNLLFEQTLGSAVKCYKYSVIWDKNTYTNVLYVNCWPSNFHQRRALRCCCNNPGSHGRLSNFKSP